MTFDYNSLNIQINKLPTKSLYVDNRHLNIYEVVATHNKLPVSRIAITLPINLNDDLGTNLLLFDLEVFPPRPKPFVSHQKTNETYRNLGINSHLIKFTNAHYSNFFNSPLYSDMIFSKETHRTQTNLVCQPGKMVWQKLEKEGVAQYIPFTNNNNELVDRWVMLSK
ncbi:MAG: hypothetical protein WC758_02645 [Candidatus Woesearchaeota archaeon]|jgi:hypothetical protein